MFVALPFSLSFGVSAFGANHRSPLGGAFLPFKKKGAPPFFNFKALKALKALLREDLALQPQGLAGDIPTSKTEYPYFKNR